MVNCYNNSNFNNRNLNELPTNPDQGPVEPCWYVPYKTSTGDTLDTAGIINTSHVTSSGKFTIMYRTNFVHSPNYGDSYPFYIANSSNNGSWSNNTNVQNAFMSRSYNSEDNINFRTLQTKSVKKTPK